LGGHTGFVQISKSSSEMIGSRTHFCLSNLRKYACVEI